MISILSDAGRYARLGALLAAGLASLSSPESLRAGGATFDFNSDPTGLFTPIGSPVYRPTGGESGGYLSVTDAMNNQRGTVVFDDFDNGLIVAGFSFTCDLRVGGGSTAPADGYSISFARENDPVVTMLNGNGFASAPAGEANLPEEGTTTGISIGLDENVNGAGDVIGVSVRVDNTLITQVALPTLNGSVTDDTSLQTGPATQTLDGNSDLPNHGWAPLAITLTTDHLLTVSYKGRTLIDQQPIDYFPSPGRIVLAARTGGRNSHHHIDNIEIETFPATLPTLTGINGDACGFVAFIEDIPGGGAFNANQPVTMRLDGLLLPATVSKDGLTTRIQYEVDLPDFLDPTLDYQVEISGTDTDGNPISFDGVFSPSPYLLLDPSWAAGANEVDTSRTGFRARTYQIPVARTPGDLNSLQNAERQLASGYFDPFTLMPYENLAEAGPEVNGTYFVDTVNWDDSGGSGGNVGGDTPMPGLFGPADHFAIEVTAWLELPEGCVTLGVNSDDGFNVSFGPDALDVFGRVTAGQFDGGRGPGNTFFDIAVTEAGLYPVRLSYWEGTGGTAVVEFFLVEDDGTVVLLNDEGEPSSLTAYPQAAAGGPVVRGISPTIGYAGFPPSEPIAIEFVDGADAGVEDGSIALWLDGIPVPLAVTSAGTLTQVIGTPVVPPAAHSTHVLELQFADSENNVRTERWTFTTGGGSVLPASLACPVTNASDPGFQVTMYQLSTGMPNQNDFVEDVLKGFFGSNVALMDTDGDFTYEVPGVLNFNITQADAGTFNSTNGFPDSVFPGIPGGGGTNNIVGDFRFWLEFPFPGTYTLGVNSDDGFRLATGLEEPPPFLTVTSPSELAGGYGAVTSIVGSAGGIGAPFAHLPIVGELVVTEPADASTPLTNSAAVAGNIALVERSGEAFETQILNAQAAGAVAVIVTNNTGGIPPIMGGSAEGILIPAVMVTQADGDAFRFSPEPVTVRLQRDLGQVLGQFDGGRGAADTLFNVTVNETGVYPMRLVWEQGAGGGNLEFFSVVGTTRTLVNDPVSFDALRAFQSCQLEDFFITDFENLGDGDFSLTFASSPGTLYNIEMSTDLRDWSDLILAIEGDAGETVTTVAGSEPGLIGLPDVFLRVVRP
ncbi:hypothetical protein BH23VER1_BH23VER1_04420 [soil metagenome]